MDTIGICEKNLEEIYSCKPKSPIRDDNGKYDHRGRYNPVCGCECLPCLLSAKSFFEGFLEREKSKQVV